MARYEFRVVVSGVELSKDHEKEVGQAVAQAGAAAIATALGGAPLSVPVDLQRWWIGIPRPELVRELEQEAQQAMRGA